MDASEKPCLKCKRPQPLKAFGSREYKGKTRWQAICRECRQIVVKK